MTENHKILMTGPLGQNRTTAQSTGKASLISLDGVLEGVYKI